MHIRLQTGEKPHQCKICQHEFWQSVPRNHKLGQCMDVKNETLEINCIFCTFSSNNSDLLRLHGFSHLANVKDIVENLPQSIKDTTFKTKEEFQKDLNVFIQQNAWYNTGITCFISKCKGKLVNLQEWGKTMTPKNMNRHIKNIHEPKKTKDMCLLAKNWRKNSFTKSVRNVVRVWTSDQYQDTQETFTMKRSRKRRKVDKPSDQAI